MELQELRVFLSVADERGFSKAAQKLGRTQPAVSQAIRRLETQLGEPLIDRSCRDGTLTEAGRLLRDYAARMLQLADEAAQAVGELRDVQRGRVQIGANEAAIHTLLPILQVFKDEHPGVQVDVRRVPARLMAQETLARAIDFGVLTFHPRERGVASLVLGTDELVLLAAPSHRLARKRRVTLELVGQEPVIAHNDPSPARERVLRAYEQMHATLNIAIALPSLDAIKRAVEMGLGVALLPRRCALAEIARGQLAAVRVKDLRIPRHVRLIYRQSGDRSHAAQAFLAAARNWHDGLAASTSERES